MGKEGGKKVHSKWKPGKVLKLRDEGKKREKEGSETYCGRTGQRGRSRES